MSRRQARTIIASDREMIRYRSGRPPDTEPGASLRELTSQWRRFIYRRLFILLRDQGEPSGLDPIIAALAAAAFLARLQHAGSRCRSSRRSRPSRWLHETVRALAGCSQRAERRVKRRGSNRHWMKVQ